MQRRPQRSPFSRRRPFSGEPRPSGAGGSLRGGPRTEPRRHQASVSLGKGALRLIPLGGFEEVGRNMMVLEYENDRIIIDIGVRFAEEDTPGIDFIIPNISYLRGKENTIRGIFITHGHLDHMGAIPFLIAPLRNPPIYTTPLTRAMILKRHDEFPSLPKLQIHTLDKKNPVPVKVGPFTVEYFHVNHNIPDAIGLAIHTPIGTVVHSCDFKFDFHPIGDEPANLQRIAEIGGKGVLALMIDSTGVENPGHSISESVVFENLDKIFREAHGRIIIATFASLIGRHQQVYKLAERYGRKVALEGYGMKVNTELAQRLNYLEVQKGTILPLRQIERMPPDRTVVLCTGAQGEANAALMRIANREHADIRVREGDTIIFSSSIIPGNERSVQNLKDALMRQGAKVFHYRMMDIHASGHAYREDLKLMISLTKPKFLVPIHGQYSMLKALADLGPQMGMPKENAVVGYNGAVIEFNKDRIQVRNENIPAEYVFVDGSGVGDIRDVVLRERQTLAQEGIFVIVTTVDRRTGAVRGEPQVISRGFIYLRESGSLIAEARRLVIKLVEQSKRHNGGDWTPVREHIKDELGKFFFAKTQRRPIVLPVIIEV